VWQLSGDPSSRPKLRRGSKLVDQRKCKRSFEAGVTWVETEGPATKFEQSIEESVEK